MALMEYSSGQGLERSPARELGEDGVVDVVRVLSWPAESCAVMSATGGAGV